MEEVYASKYEYFTNCRDTVVIRVWFIRHWTDV
jgi:hypothetical protein